MKNGHEPIEIQSLDSSVLCEAVADTTLPQGTGLTAAFGAHRVRAAHISDTALLRMTSCQKH